MRGGALRHGRNAGRLEGVRRGTWAAKHSLDADALIRIGHGRQNHETLRLVAPHLETPEELAALVAAEEDCREGIVEVPGARELLAGLPLDRWADVTSAWRRLATIRLECAGLPVPRVLVTADQVARGKPDPEGYLLAAARLDVGALPCVVEVHDLHIWAMRTTETALTAHLVMPGNGREPTFLASACKELHDKFDIDHSLRKRLRQGLVAPAVIIDAAEKGDLRLIWVYVSSALFEATPIRKFQAAHDVSRPLNVLSVPDAELVLKDVAATIREAALGATRQFASAGGPAVSRRAG
jgi:hypothetical protein